MHTNRLLIFIFIAFQAMAAQVWAATYYVDSTIGNDANPGTQSSPWKRSPGMTGWTGSKTLIAGDVVYFNNAGIWTGSGGSALLSPKGGVTYDGSTWGTGQKATLQATGTFSSAIVSFNSDNPTLPTVVKGFKVNGNGTVNSGININWPSSANLIGATKRIEGCEVYGLKLIKDGSARYGIKAGATGGDTLSNLEILDTKVHDVNTTGIAIYSAVNCPTCLISNVKIKGCTVGPNIKQYDTWNGTGIIFKNNQKNVILEQSEIFGAVLNNIIIQDDGSGAPQNLTIRNNSIHNSPSHGITVQTPSKTSFELYGNIIYGNAKKGIDFAGNVGSGPHNVKILANTFYQNTGGEVNFSSSNATYSALELKNNIIYAGTQNPLTSSKANIITAHSNNLYYRASGTLASVGGTSYTSSNISTFENSSVATNPNFVSASGGNFSLSSNSSAIGKGANLGTPYSSSLLTPGSIWPNKLTLATETTSTGFDVGAYAYNGVSVPPTPEPTPEPTPTPTPISAPSTAVLINAESGTLTAPMQIASTPNTPGGSYIVTPTSNSGSAVYNFNITQAGTYKIIAEAFAANASSDSFRIKIDNGTAYIWDLNPTGNSALYNIWRQSEITGRGTGTLSAPQFNPLTVQLSSGSHTITVSGIESNTRLDYFYFVKLPVVTPLVEAESGKFTTPMKAVSLTAASGGAYIATTTSNLGSAVYTLNIAKSGVYKIVANAFASNSASDSFLVKIDNGTGNIWDLNPTGDATFYNIWREIEVTSRGTGIFSAPQFDPFTVNLSSGSHTITFVGREPNTRLDNFYLEQLPADASITTLKITQN